MRRNDLLIVLVLVFFGIVVPLLVDLYLPCSADFKASWDDICHT